MKRVLILTLALMLLTSSALAVGFDTSKGYPVVEEPVTFNILAKQHMFHVNWDEMDLWKDYEAMTGVHIDWTLVPSESFDEKRNLLMAANELPDAIMIAQLDQRAADPVRRGWSAGGLFRSAGVHAELERRHGKISSGQSRYHHAQWGDLRSARYF